LKMDIFQLADVFEAFRRMAMEQDGLDPSNYVSIPGLTWDSAFKMTNASLELLQDSIMYEFFEAGIRGGITVINKHCVERNSPDDLDFDATRPHTELLYIDANNLYGQALSMPLPQKDFRWVESEAERGRWMEKLPEMDVNGEVGFVVEVDLEIPTSIQDRTDDFPLAPEKAKIRREWLSEYMKELLGDGHFHSTEKLLLTHIPKKHYVIHFALLQFFIDMGAIVTKVHRLVTFHQSTFFRPYIQFK
jgi:hypothetical protein